MKFLKDMLNSRQLGNNSTHIDTLHDLEKYKTRRNSSQDPSHRGNFYIKISINHNIYSFHGYQKN